MTGLHVPDIAGLDVIGAVLAYAKAGFYMLPVSAGSKHPGSVVGAGWPAKSTRDPETIINWFAGTSHMPAAHVGRSGCTAFDIDRPAVVPHVLARHLTADVPYQATRRDVPGRGHWLFRQPPGRALGNSRGSLGEAWGEVRGRNGVIVVEPATHSRASEGGCYRWVRTGEVPELPDELARALPDSLTPMDAASDDQVAGFLEQHTRSIRPQMVRGPLSRWDVKMAGGASRHETAVACLVWALKEARVGFFAARHAHDELASRFLTAHAEPRPGDRVLSPAAAASEWAGIVSWAVAQAQSSDPRAVFRRAQASAARRYIGGVSA